MPRAPKRGATKKKEAVEGPTIKSGGTRSRALVERPAGPIIGVEPKKAKPANRLNVNGRKTKPSYLRMVKEAIRANAANNIHGATSASIANYIKTNFPVPIERFNARLRLSLSRAVDNEQLEKLTNNRYKISKSERERDGRKTLRKSAKKAADGEQAPKKKRAAPKKRVPKEGEKPKKKAAPKKRSAAAAKEGAPPKAKARKAVAKKRAAAPEGAPAAAASGETKWVWQYKDGSWYNYDFDASEQVETVYQDYLKNPGQTDVRSVTSGQWDYMVDFRQMTQQNLRHESHTKRQIRRVQLPVEELKALANNPRSKSYPENF